MTKSLTYYIDNSHCQNYSVAVSVCIENVHTERIQTRKLNEKF